MRVISDHEDTVPGHARAAINAAGCVSDQVLRSGTLVMPDFTAAARIKRIALIGAGYVHDTVRDNGRHLQARRIRQTEDPPRCETLDVAFVNLRQLAITAARSQTVVSSPIALRCYRPV